MADIFWFAIHSARWQSEIVHLLWDDNHDREETGLVRDAKHSVHKDDNHKQFKFTPEASAIVQRQPQVDARIFPFNPRTISRYFANACNILEIPDHDSTTCGTRPVRDHSKPSTVLLRLCSSRCTRTGRRCRDTRTCGRAMSRLRSPGKLRGCLL